MKQLITVLLSIAWFCTLNNTAFAYDSPVTVRIDGKAVHFEVAPVIENGYTLVPMRAIFEEFGANVIWEGSSHTVSAGKGDMAIKYKIGQAKAERNGQIATLDYPGKIIDGSTMMPVRFVTEAFGAAVGWDESTKTVNISSPPKQLAEIVRVLDGFYLEVKYQNFRGENVQENVRLAGISPIHNGMDATEYTQKILPIGSKVLIEARGSRDRNKHLRADVYLSDNSLLNAKLVADGYAMLSANLKDEKLNAMLVSLQREAKVQKSGLWAQQDQAGLPTTIKKISIGPGQIAVVTDNGDLWTWGQFYEKPTKIMDHVTEAKVYSDEGMALKEDGTVWVWGFNNGGLFGNEKQEYVVTVIPRQVEGLHDITAIDKKFTAAAALDRNGRVFMWGSNFNGKLGLPYDYKNIIVSKPFNTSWKDVRSVSIGFLFTVVLKNDGTVWKTQPNSSELIQLKELTDIVAVSAQNSAALALKKDGTVWGWGEWNDSIFGNGELFQEAPQQIQGLAKIVQIDAGQFHFFAIDQEGQLFGWGENDHGNLGVSSKEGTVKIPMLANQISPVRIADAGSENSIFLKTDGTLWGVGHNPYNIFGEDGVINPNDGLNYQGLTKIQLN